MENNLQTHHSGQQHDNHEDHYEASRFYTCFTQDTDQQHQHQVVYQYNQSNVTEHYNDEFDSGQEPKSQIQLSDGATPVQGALSQRQSSSSSLSSNQQTLGYRDQSDKCNSVAPTRGYNKMSSALDYMHRPNEAMECAHENLDIHHYEDVICENQSNQFGQQHHYHMVTGHNSHYTCTSLHQMTHECNENFANQVITTTAQTDTKLDDCTNGTTNWIIEDQNSYRSQLSSLGQHQVQHMQSYSLQTNDQEQNKMSATNSNDFNNNTNNNNNQLSHQQEESAYSSNLNSMDTKQHQATHLQSGRYESISSGETHDHQSAYTSSGFYSSFRQEAQQQLEYHYPEQQNQHYVHQSRQDQSQLQHHHSFDLSNGCHTTSDQRTPKQSVVTQQESPSPNLGLNSTSSNYHEDSFSLGPSSCTYIQSELPVGQLTRQSVDCAHESTRIQQYNTGMTENQNQSNVYEQEQHYQMVVDYKSQFSCANLQELNHECNDTFANQVTTTTAMTLDHSGQLAPKSRPLKGRRGRPRKKGHRSKNKVNGKLWEFIRDLLLNERTNPSFIRWERREDGVFKFVQSDKVAKMWGERKQNPKMTYEKLSRAMRYYYKSKVLLPVFGRRLVYKFGPNATGWLPSGDHSLF